MTLKEITNELLGDEIATVYRGEGDLPARGVTTPVSDLVKGQEAEGDDPGGRRLARYHDEQGGDRQDTSSRPRGLPAAHVSPAVHDCAHSHECR